MTNKQETYARAMVEELVEIAPGVYRTSLPKSLDWVAAFFYKDTVFYNANFTGKQCETITKSLEEMSAKVLADKSNSNTGGQAHADSIHN